MLLTPCITKIIWRIHNLNVFRGWSMFGEGRRRSHVKSPNRKATPSQSDLKQTKVCNVNARQTQSKLKVSTGAGGTTLTYGSLINGLLACSLHKKHDVLVLLGYNHTCVCVVTSVSLIAKWEKWTWFDFESFPLSDWTVIVLKSLSNVFICLFLFIPFNVTMRFFDECVFIEWCVLVEFFTAYI